MAETKQFIYVLRTARLGMLTEGPTAREESVVSEHYAYLQALTEQGTAILVGRMQTADEKTLGIVIFKAGSLAEAEALMAADPAVQNGVMTAEVFPFRIALMNADAA